MFYLKELDKKNFLKYNFVKGLSPTYCILQIMSLIIPIYSGWEVKQVKQNKAYEKLGEYNLLWNNKNKNSWACIGGGKGKWKSRWIHTCNLKLI